MISIFPEMARSPSDVVGLGYPIIDKWCTKAVLSATLNGSYTAEFTIPHKAKGVKRELLPDVKQVIKLIDMDGDEEYFRVRRFKHNLKETVITAEHISYDLIDNLIEDINNVDKDGQGIMDKISAGTQYKHPFRLTSDILKTANIRMVRMNPIQALIGTADNTFVNRLGGELKRKQFTLAMNESIGTHRTDVIRSRRNLTGFEREINLEDYATRIMPRAKNGIELPEKYVDSPHIAPDHPVIKVIDYSDVEYDGEFKDLSDSDKNRVYNELRACAKADFAAGRDVPNASYEVDFITLRNTVEYADYRALENYNLGDTVSIYEADYDVEIEAKVISFEWDVLKKRYTSMKLGSFKNGIVRSNFNKTNSVDAKISQAQSTADIALLSADGKTTNFYGTGEPVNPKKGDTWFKKNGSEEEVWQYQEVDGVMMWVYVTGTRYANALKESIAHDFSEVTQQITEQQQAHDRTVAEILAQVDSTQSLAEQAKAIGDQAKADAVNLASQLSTAKTALQNSINDTKSQIATVSQALSTAKTDLQTQVNAIDAKAVQAQTDVDGLKTKAETIKNDLNTAKSELQTQVNAADAKAVQAQTDVDGLKTKAETIKNDLNTAKSELQTQVNAADAKAVQAQRDITQAKSDLQNQASQLITQAAKQVELTKLTTETKQLADGTLTSLNELSKTVDKNTGNITSVANRTKTVEDNLAGVKTNYTQLNQTVNAQTGQIDSINRKTADLQSGIDGVNNRFETIWASENNLLSNTETLSTYSPLAFPTNNYLGRAIKRITKSANSSVLAEGLVMQTNETLVNPKEMILSFHVKANRDARIRCFMYNPNANKDVATSDGYTAKSSADGMAVLNVTTSWQRVWIKWTYLVNYLAKPRIIIGRILETYDTDVSVDISAPALYHGHHNKEWSPAGLDFKNELATYVQSAQESSAELSRRIETADGKAVDAKAYAQQTATQLSNRLTSLETYKNAEGTRAQAYFEAAKTETAKQITAERSVIARDYTAKSTYQEDVTSIRRTISETKTELGSVTNRTKVVEDDLSGTKTKLEQVKATADTTSRKTAELQNGIDGVTERFDALRTGGKNLILNSAYPTNLEHWSGNMVIANHGFYYNGQKSLFKLQTSSTSEITASTNRFDVKRNTDYTISFYAFASGNVSSADVWFLGRKAGEANDFTSTNMFIGARRLSPVKAEYVTVTFNSGDNDTGYIRFDNNGSTDGNASYLLFGEIMLVEGTIPQTHQFADEDLSNKIAEYKRTADQNYSGLQSTISTLDGKITQNKTSADQTAEAIKSRLTSLETYKNAEGTRAQAYFEAAKTETAKQITAERSVIARDYTAKSTYQEDVTSIRRTISETKTELGSVTNRTKVVEDDLSGTKTKLEQVKATADTTSRKTAELQSGLDGVQERFESLQVGNKNYLPTSRVVNRGCTNFRYNETSQSWSMTVPTGATTGFGYGITFNTSGLNILLNGGETLFFGLMIKANKTCSFNYDINNTLSGSTSNDNDDRNKQVWSPSNKSIPANVWTRVWFSYTAKANVPIVETNSNFGIVNNTEAVDIEIKEVIVAKSKVPVDYQSPDADIESKFAEYKRTADQNYSGLQSTISTLDGKITQNKSEQVQTAEAIKTRLSSLETYKNTEGTRAQAYFEAAKTETAKQITAERTAITNNYVAKSTYQEDAAGVTRRLTATETVANRADTTANSAVTKATNAQSTADTAKANVTTVTTRLATYQETNDRRVAALETAKHSTDGTLTQLSNKVEQNAQQTRETISAVEAKIPTDFGGDNLILEGDRQEAGKYWNNTDLFTHSFYYSGQKKLFRLQTSSASEITTSSNRFLVKRNTKYSLSFWTFSAGNVSSFDVWFLGRKAGETNDFTSPNLLVGAHKNSPGSAEYVTATFDSGNNDEGYIRFDNNGSSDGNNALFAFGEVMLVEGTIPKHFSKNVAEVITEISNAKLDITKTAEGLKLAATKTELTNAQNNLQSGINAAKSAAESAQAKANSNASTITQHSTQITALNNELSAKVSKKEYDELTGRVTGAETSIKVQAGEISKRLTSTQVESAITAKGYQTKAQVDSNITGRGYITSSALQPYATTTVLENKVRETVDSFNRTISAVRLEIPTNASMRNLILKSSDKWGFYTSTNNANSNWCPEICRITLDLDRGVTVGKKLNLFVYISANNVTLDSSSNHIIAIQACIIKKDGTNLWHADVPFHGQWSQNLKAGNNYYVIKLTNEIKETAYENGATLIVQCRIDGANHVDFHHRAAMITTGDMFPDTWYPAPEDMATVVAFNKVSDTVDHHTQTLKDQEGRINTVLQTATTAYQLLQDGGRIYEDLKTVKGQIQQVRDANYATRIETLAGSWAVKNLTSGGQMLNQFNLLANGINHIDGRLTHITGDTLIDRGVIKSAMIGNGQIGTAHIGTIDASQANIINLNVNKLVGFDATFIKGKFDNVIADLLKGKTVAAQNGAMNVDLLNAKINLLADSSAIRRVFNGYPTQFIKYGTMIDSNGNKFSKTIIGSNRDGSENSGNATFSGIEIFNSATTSVEDYTKIYADKLYLKHDGGDHGWLVQTSNKQRIIPLDGTIPSEIMAKDFLMIYNDNGNATSLRDHIAAIVHNITELANRTGGMTNIWSIKA